jgi:hypothetical protein
MKHTIYRSLCLLVPLGSNLVLLALGIDPATLMLAVDPVGNGSISVLKYQAQGFSVERVP